MIQRELCMLCTVAEHTVSVQTFSEVVAFAAGTKHHLNTKNCVQNISELYVLDTAYLRVASKRR